MEVIIKGFICEKENLTFYSGFNWEPMKTGSLKVKSYSSSAWKEHMHAMG